MSETRRKGKDLLNHMRAAKLTEYGAVITGDEVRSTLGLEIPATGSKQTFDKLSLLELGAVDYVRNVLLGEGKYLGQHNGNYRVFLPSENLAQIHKYMAHADNKLRRGLKLWRNAPVTDDAPMDNTGARLLMKRESLKSRRILD